MGWEITVSPISYDDIVITLPATADCTSETAVCTSTGQKLETGISELVPGLAAASVADAEVHEGPGATLDFVVTLTRPAERLDAVRYRTVDGTARAGEDYEAKSSLLFFDKGVTVRTVSVPVFDDAIDEGSETMRLELSEYPHGGRLSIRIADGTAIGTINNTDPMPKAWIARFGRTVGSQVVDALNQRLEGANRSHVTVAGINVLGGSGVEPEIQDEDPFGLPEWAKSARVETDERTITTDDILLRSAFHLSSAQDRAQGRGPAYTAWGRVATRGFEAEEDDVTMDGDVTTGLIGFDAEWRRLLAGVMLSQSTGEGSYRLDPAKGAGGGTVESSLTGVYPYAILDLNARVSAWVLAGAGSGELTLKPQGEKPMATDISMRMGALGVKGKILEGAGTGGLTMNVKSDAMWVGTKNKRTKDMIATEGDVTRLRLVLEGERTFAIEGGATFVPSGEVGLRFDGGDAETGAGVEHALDQLIISVVVQVSQSSMSDDEMHDQQHHHDVVGVDRIGLEVAEASPQPLLDANEGEEVLKENESRIRRQILCLESDLHAQRGFTANLGFAKFHVWSPFHLVHRRLATMIVPVSETTSLFSHSFSSPNRCPWSSRFRGIRGCGLASQTVNLSYMAYGTGNPTNIRLNGLSSGNFLQLTGLGGDVPFASRLTSRMLRGR